MVVTAEAATPVALAVVSDGITVISRQGRVAENPLVPGYANSAGTTITEVKLHYHGKWAAAGTEFHSPSSRKHSVAKPTGETKGSDVAERMAGGIPAGGP